MYKHILALPHIVHKSFHFMILPFSNTKNYFPGFFLPDDYSLDLKTFQQQQSQDPVVRTVFSWLTRNENFLHPHHWYSFLTCILQKVFTTIHRTLYESD